MNTDEHLINQFLTEHPHAAIQFIEELDIDEIAQLIETLPDNHCELIISRLAAYKTGKVLEKVSLDKASRVIDLLNPQVSQSILRVTNSSIREEILKNISTEKAAYLRRILKYPKDRVGAHVEPFVLTLSNSVHIEKALASINSSKAIIKPHIFILDEEGKLTGYVELNNLITGDSTAQIRSISNTIKKPALADMSVTDLLENWDNTFIDLPVVNGQGLFLGTVSRDTLSELIRGKTKIGNPMVKAGNALGDLYLIGLTSLLGNPESTIQKK